MAADRSRRRKVLLAVALALEAEFELMNGDDEDNDDVRRRRRRVVPSVVDFGEVTVPSMDDVQFRRHFRLKRETFYEVIPFYLSVSLVF